MRVTRRRLLVAATAGALAAGTRSGHGEDRGASRGTSTDRGTPTERATPPETPTDRGTPTGTPRESRSETVDVGERVDGADLALVVRSVDRRTFFEGGAGMVPATSLVSVAVAVKNDDDEPLDLRAVSAPRLVDGDGNSYPPLAGLSSPALPPGQLVAGEVGRGTYVYAVPATAADLRFEAVLRPLGRFDVDRATVDLDDEADRRQDLGQDLDVEVRRIGETATGEGVSVTLSARRISPLVGGERAARGNEFVVPTVAVANGTPDPLPLPVAAAARVKDDAGRSFAVDEAAHGRVAEPLAAEPPVPPGETRRGQLPYEVPDDGRTLYWTFDLSLLDAGEKAFWRLR